MGGIVGQSLGQKLVLESPRAMPEAKVGKWAVWVEMRVLKAHYKNPKGGYESDDWTKFSTWGTTGVQELRGATIPGAREVPSPKVSRGLDAQPGKQGEGYIQKGYSCSGYHERCYKLRFFRDKGSLHF